jgi:tRNA(Ile)-lysidine synthase
LARSHGLDITCESRDVKVLAAERKLSLEAAGREARYDFFRRVLQSTANRVATGHTLDDQAETVLLKLTRGAGTRGMAGIFPKLAVNRELPAGKPETGKKVNPEFEASIVRPLLGTRRSQLRSYLNEIGQAWREDASNQDLRHGRNRIRSEIIHRLERELNPSVAEVLAEAADIARAEEEFWAAEIECLLPQTFSTDGNAGRLDLAALQKFPLAVQRRLVRSVAESLQLTLNFNHVEEVLALHEGERASLPGGWAATRAANHVVFAVPSAAQADYEYALTIGGKIVVAEAGLTLEAIVVVAEDLDGAGPSALLDDPFVRHPLVVRNWRPGERFWPLHTKEAKKIKELLQDRHITGEKKRLWPVIASGEEIVWLRGFGVRRDFQARGSRGILIRELPLETQLKR